MPGRQIERSLKLDRAATLAEGFELVGLGQLIDTPVRHYSSGMVTRASTSVTKSSPPLV